MPTSNMLFLTPPTREQSTTAPSACRLAHFTTFRCGGLYCEPAGPTPDGSKTLVDTRCCCAVYHLRMILHVPCDRNMPHNLLALPMVAPLAAALASTPLASSGDPHLCITSPHLSTILAPRNSSRYQLNRVHCCRRSSLQQCSSPTSAPLTLSAIISISGPTIPPAAHG